MEEFKQVILEAFGANIEKCQSIGDKTLLVVVKPELDFEEFVSAVRDMRTDLHGFKPSFALYLLQASEDYQDSTGAYLKQALVTKEL